MFYSIFLHQHTFIQQNTPPTTYIFSPTVCAIFFSLYNQSPYTWLGFAASLQKKYHTFFLYQSRHCCIFCGHFSIVEKTPHTKAPAADLCDSFFAGSSSLTFFFLTQKYHRETCLQVSLYFFGLSDLYDFFFLAVTTLLICSLTICLCYFFSISQKPTQNTPLSHTITLGMDLCDFL